MTDVTNTVRRTEALPPSTEKANLTADVSSLRSQLCLLRDKENERTHNPSEAENEALRDQEDRFERSYQQLQQRYDDLNQRHKDLQEEVAHRHDDCNERYDDLKQRHKDLQEEAKHRNTAYEAFREEVEDRLEAFREEFETQLSREQEETAVQRPTKRPRIPEDPEVEEKKKKLHSHFHHHMKHRMGVSPKGRIPDFNTPRPSDRDVVRVDWDKPYDCPENRRLMNSAISQLESLDRAVDGGKDFASLARALGRQVTDSVCLSWFQKRKYERNYHARLTKPQQDFDAMVRRRNARKERKLQNRQTALWAAEGREVREMYPEAGEIKAELMSDEESDSEGRIHKKVQAWRSLRAERMIAALDAIARDLHHGKNCVRQRPVRPETRDTYLRMENGVPVPVPASIHKAHVSQDFANQWPDAVSVVARRDPPGEQPSSRDRWGWGEGFDSTVHRVEVSHPAH